MGAKPCALVVSLGLGDDRSRHLPSEPAFPHAHASQKLGHKKECSGLAS